MRTRSGLMALCLAAAAAGATPALAGDDPMARAAGQALVDSTLPGGTVVVRLGQRSLSNPVVGTQVTLTVAGTNGDRRTADTDANGRATFSGLPEGSRIRASATVNQETLETSDLEVQSSAGVRTMLVFAAAEGDGAAGGADHPGTTVGTAAATAPTPGPGAASGSGNGALPPGHPPVNAQIAPDEDGDEGELGTFDAGVPVGTAVADAQVPRGTVLVEVRDARGAVVAGREVSLISIRRAGGLAVKKAATGDDGRVSMSPGGGPGDSGYAAAIEHQGVRLSTRPFTMPEDKGIRVELPALEITSDPSAVSVGSGGRVIVQLREDTLQIMEVLPLHSRPGTLFVPRDKGLLFPLPAGFVGAQAVDGSRIEVLESQGVVLQGPIPPAGVRGPGGDVTHVSFGYFIKTNQAGTFTVRHPAPYGLGMFALIVEKAPGLQFEIDGAAGPGEDREGGGQHFTMQAVQGVPPGRELVFTLRGLPRTDQSLSWIAGGLAALMVLAAAIAARRARGAKDGSARRRELQGRRDELMAELVQLERARRTAQAGDTRGTAKREKLISRLEPVYRELAALEDGHLS